MFISSNVSVKTIKDQVDKIEKENLSISKIIGNNQIEVGKEYNFEVKGVSEPNKCLWSISNNKIIYKNENYYVTLVSAEKVLVKALSRGTSDIHVKCGDKKLTRRVRVVSNKKILSNIKESDTHDNRLKKLFGGKIPKNKKEIEKYLVITKINYIDKKGNKKTKNIFIHKKLASQVKNIFKEIEKAGFPAYDIQVYNHKYRTNSDTIKKLSDHAYGVAIDINPKENCYKINGKCTNDYFYKPNKNKYSITKNSVVYKAFTKRGWIWGGDWYPNQDYMHFSFAGE